MGGINPIILKLLDKRGIHSEEDILEFLSDKPQETYDPFLLKNMEAGVDLILSAIENGGKICVYGDYDADGITSVCLMTQVLSNLTGRLEYYVPSRFDEGYGLNNAAIEKIRNGGADLIITVDCGSVSCGEVAFARELGLEIVITDHHNTTDDMPDCLVINPKQPDCKYPFKHLAGVGVAFKLAQGIQKKAGLGKSVLSGVLDLVAVGTIGDFVPLTGENRTIAKYGLRELNRCQRKGFKALADAINLKSGAISSQDVAFMIVPHLNAAGRMLSADSAVDLLLAEDGEAIYKNVERLTESNASRKCIQEDMYRSCVEIVEAHMPYDKFLLIRPPITHEGVAGIVAGKIMEKYNKPAVIVTPSEGGYKGTGRGAPGINLYDLLSGFSDLFLRFGGHAEACGFMIRHDDLDVLKSGLEEKMKDIHMGGPGTSGTPYDFDLRLSGKDVTLELGELLECLAPFGNQNRKPVFLIAGVTIRNAVQIGEGGKHLKFTGHTPDGGIFNCILFNKAEEYQETICSSGPSGIIGTIETQVFNGVKSVKFHVDIIIKEGFIDDND